MKRSELIKLRTMIEKASASLTDTDALEAKELFAEWEVGKAYAVGDRVHYEADLFKCVQAHTSQADWTPPAVPALWTEVAEPHTIPVWRQPTGAQDAYMKGDLVHYPTEADPVYESTEDNNVWAPDVYGWILHEEGEEA